MFDDLQNGFGESIPFEIWFVTVKKQKLLTSFVFAEVQP